MEATNPNVLCSDKSLISCHLVMNDITLEASLFMQFPVMCCTGVCAGARVRVFTWVRVICHKVHVWGRLEGRLVTNGRFAAQSSAFLCFFFSRFSMLSLSFVSAASGAYLGKNSYVLQLFHSVCIRKPAPPHTYNALLCHWPSAQSVLQSGAMDTDGFPVQYIVFPIFKKLLFGTSDIVNI